MPIDQKQIDELCEVELSNLTSMLLIHGSVKVHEHVWATVGAYMVLMVQLGGTPLVEESAIKLERLIDATRLAASGVKPK